jgi:hypothetical protein
MVQANLTLAEILLAVVFMRSRSLYIGAQVYQINILERVSTCQEGIFGVAFWTTPRIWLFVMKKKKNPHAVALGKIGGAKGGKMRAAKLSPERRREIARKAVLTRWAKQKNKEQKSE